MLAVFQIADAPSQCWCFCARQCCHRSKRWGTKVYRPSALNEDLPAICMVYALLSYFKSDVCWLLKPPRSSKSMAENLKATEMNYSNGKKKDYEFFSFVCICFVTGFVCICFVTGVLDLSLFFLQALSLLIFMLFVAFKH